MAQYLPNTVYNRKFKMIDSTDHLSKKAGLSPVVNILKTGGSWGAAAGVVTDVGNGWYNVALTTTDTNTVGDLAFYITATGADDTDFCDQVSYFSANILQLNGQSQPAINLAAIYNAFETGTLQSGGSSTTVKLRSGASAVDNYFKDQAIFILTGPGAGQTNRITGYVGSTKIATLGTSWATQPDNTSTYLIIGRIG